MECKQRIKIILATLIFCLTLLPFAADASDSRIQFKSSAKVFLVIPTKVKVVSNDSQFKIESNGSVYVVADKTGDTHSNAGSKLNLNQTYANTKAVITIAPIP